MKKENRVVITEDDPDFWWKWELALQRTREYEAKLRREKTVRNIAAAEKRAEERKQRMIQTKENPQPKKPCRSEEERKKAQQEYNRRYHAAHSEQIRLRKHQYYLEHREEYIEKARQRYRLKHQNA